MENNIINDSVVVNIRDGLTDSAFIEDRLLVNQARHERGRADLIDTTGNALGVFENALQGIIGEERTRLVVILLHFQPDLKRQPAQAALYHTWHRLWTPCGANLLPCYDLVGLPPDNLKLEARFEQLLPPT